VSQQIRMMLNDDDELVSLRPDCYALVTRRVRTVRQIFDFVAQPARYAAPPLKNQRLSPFGAKFTRGRSRKGALFKRVTWYYLDNKGDTRVVFSGQS
jgi:hypothetical protein